MPIAVAAADSLASIGTSALGRAPGFAAEKPLPFSRSHP
jgi:hypothetical protein